MDRALEPILGPATQLGFVVRDVEAAIRHWTEVFGVGPFIVMEHGTAQPPPPTFMRGEEVSVELKLGFGFMGDVQIELIEQRNDAPSPYAEFLAAGREGLQHLGFWVHDHAEATRRRPAAHPGVNRGQRSPSQVHRQWFAHLAAPITALRTESQKPAALGIPRRFTTKGRRSRSGWSALATNGSRPGL